MELNEEWHEYVWASMTSYDKRKLNEKRVENREGSLGYPWVVKPVFIKDSKPFGKGSLDHLGVVTPVLI
ncbi:hypothetical protein TNCV_3547391 [Trichonephila clavipes]|nr:hypothetical protein TNCV_3547391 [Trichonephila clavipes]